jgi:hypothetical protein
VTTQDSSAHHRRPLSRTFVWLGAISAIPAILAAAVVWLVARVFELFGRSEIGAGYSHTEPSTITGTEWLLLFLGLAAGAVVLQVVVGGGLLALFRLNDGFAALAPALQGLAAWAAALVVAALAVTGAFLIFSH